MTVRDELYEYINENFLYLQPDLELTDEDRFLELGVIDSTGVVELVGEVEERYGDHGRGRRDHRGELRLARGPRPVRREQARRGGLGMAVRTLDDHLRASAARTPDKIAIVAGDRRVSYGELDRLADGIAGGLIASGIERGDRVGVFLPNTVEGAASIYGVLRAGAGVLAAQPDDEGREARPGAGRCRRRRGSSARARTAASSRTRAAFAPSAAHGRVRRRRPGRRRAVRAARRARGAALAARDRHRPRRADLHLGLDGQAEGRDADAPEHDLRRGARWPSTSRCSQDEVVLLCLPLSFDYGLYQLLLTVLVGGTLVLEKGFAFPGQRRRAARERGRHGPARRAHAVRRAARPARPRRARAAGAALPLQHGRRALGHDDRRPARDVPAGPHLLDVRPHRVQARLLPAAAPDRRQAGVGRRRDPGHRGLGRGRRGQRVRPGRGRRADGARAARHAGLLERRSRRPPSGCAPVAGPGSAS